MPAQRLRAKGRSPDSCSARDPAGYAAAPADARSVGCYPAVPAVLRSGRNCRDLLATPRVCHTAGTAAVLIVVGISMQFGQDRLDTYRRATSLDSTRASCHQQH